MADGTGSDMGVELKEEKKNPSFSLKGKGANAPLTV